jgi:hypothetical protein
MEPVNRLGIGSYLILNVTTHLVGSMIR